jgi:hypothetical protein
MSTRGHEPAPGPSLEFHVAGHVDVQAGLDRLRRSAANRRWKTAGAVAAFGVLALALAFGVRDGSSTVQISSGPATSEPGPSAPGLTAPTRPMPSDRVVRGIPGLRRDVPGGTAVQVITISGDSLWVVLPQGLVDLPKLEVIPDFPLIVKDNSRTPRQTLTTTPGETFVTMRCLAAPVCAAVVLVESDVLANGALLQVWSTNTDDPIVVVQMDRWTLVLEGPDSALAKRLAGALRWSVDSDGYLFVQSENFDIVSTDTPGASLVIPATDSQPDIAIRVTPGCDGDAELRRPPVGPELRQEQNGARWCSNGFAVVIELHGDVPDRTMLSTLHATLHVSGSL